jgi:NAD(P)-dependent dehydrogenase (short-subunit alcohol dehydrogenase family)
MRRMFAVSIVVLLASSAAAAPAPEESWGKAGVSLSQYRQDAVDCAQAGYYLDISKSDDAQQFVRASRELNNLPGPSIYQTVGTGPGSSSSVDVTVNFAGIQQHIIESVRPGERFKSIKQMQLAKTDECLVRRGYSKFRLRDDQRRQLHHLKFGSDERRAYLYSLASDSAVLAAQKAPAQP